MVTTLTGENYFGLRLELDDIVDRFLAEQGEMGLERIDGEEVDFDRISEALTSLPFLASKKLIVFKNPSNNKDFAAGFEKLLDNLPDTTELVLVDSKLDKRTAFYKYLKKASDYREFNKLRGQELVDWLVKQAQASGGQLSTSDARSLVDRAGEDQQLLASDLDKLLVHNPKISKNDIELLVEKTPQSKVFDMLDAVLAGNIQRAMTIYREQRTMQVAPQEVIGMLSWQLKMLAIIRTSDKRSALDVARDFGMKPYGIQKSWQVAQAMSLAQIKRYIRQLVALDVRLKSESIDADAALGQYLLELAR